MNTYIKIFHIWKKGWLKTKGKREEEEKGKYLVAILGEMKTYLFQQILRTGYQSKNQDKLYI